MFPTTRWDLIRAAADGCGEDGESRPAPRAEAILPALQHVFAYFPELIGGTEEVEALAREAAMTWHRSGGRARVVAFRVLESARQGIGSSTDSTVLPDGRQDLLFDRAWSKAVLVQVWNALRVQYADTGEESRFEVLHPFLEQEVNGVDAEAAATRMDMPLEVFREEVAQLRWLFGVKLRKEVARTVTGPHEIEAELRHLIAALTAKH